MMLSLKFCHILVRSHSHTGQHMSLIAVAITYLMLELFLELVDHLLHCSKLVLKGEIVSSIFPSQYHIIATCVPHKMF